MTAVSDARVSAEHAPLTVDEGHMLATDAELSAVMLQAIERHDCDTLADAIAEKRSIERALAVSRDGTYLRHTAREFGVSP